MTGNHKPQRDYVIEAINDLLADEEAGIFEPTHSQNLGSNKSLASGGSRLSTARPRVSADLSNKGSGSVIPIRSSPRQGRS
jgi:hypothetical protein